MIRPLVLQQKHYISKACKLFVCGFHYTLFPTLQIHYNANVSSGLGEERLTFIFPIFFLTCLDAE